VRVVLGVGEPDLLAGADDGRLRLHEQLGRGRDLAGGVEFPHVLEVIHADRKHLPRLDRGEERDAVDRANLGPLRQPGIEIAIGGVDGFTFEDAVGGGSRICILVANDLHG
jgi:hypothetical protein